jgi:alpha-mannosidase
LSFVALAVGWLKTVDQYYYGSDSDIQNANVQLILDAVTAELARNPARKFTYVETGFFERWWRNRPQFQDLVRGFVASGQLAFINGGYCMHDEANPSFVDMLDQTSVGHRFLLETFNVTPKTTWQIDPFGHSGFQGSVLSTAQAGFQAVHWARDDFQEFKQRSAAKTNELFWYPSPSMGKQGGTFASSLFYYYYPPPGFNWCYGSSDDPIQDDPTLENYNVQSRVNDFITNVMAQANATQGEDLIWTMGCDFAYDNAAYWFGNLDKLIKYVNADGRVNAMYSNPNIYSQAKINSIAFPLKSEDYFPLIDAPGHGVWSGYFTSRPALKGYIRETGSYQQMARQLQLWTGGVESSADDPSQPLYLLERAQAVNQHHDAVSGTSKQAVAYDYALRLAVGRTTTDEFLGSAYSQLTGDSAAKFVGCDLANVTICPVLEAAAQGTPIMLALYNQQAQGGQFLVRLPVPVVGPASYAVSGPTGEVIAAQLLPTSENDVYLRNQYYNYTSSVDTVQWLAFMATLPPAGFAMHFIQPVSSASDAPNTFQSTITEINVGSDNDAQLTNGLINITISGSTGIASGWWSPETGSLPLSQSFAWYNASKGVPGPNYGNQQASGAYIFRPNSSQIYQATDLSATAFNQRTGRPVAYAPPIPGVTSALTVTLVTGPVINEARQVFSSWVSQTIRITEGSSTAEFEFTIGSIPFQDGLGREVITQYTIPSWTTDSTFITDSNCRDSQVRIKGYRRAFNFKPVEPVASVSSLGSRVD